MQETRSLRFAAALFAALIGACELGTEPGGPEIANIRVVPPTASITVEATVQLSATIEDDTGSPLEGTVHWASEDEGVATVSGTGNVTGVAPGTVRIAASSGGISSLATIQVEPKQVATVTVTPAEHQLVVGDEVVLSAAGRDAGGEVLAGRAVSWKSLDEKVATVDAGGRVRALAPGTAEVTATIEGKVGRAEITVVAEPVTSVEVEPAVVTLVIGATTQLQAITRADDGTPLGGRAVTWSTDDEEVATVSAGGLVTAVAVGTARITASSEGRSGSATVTVQVKPVASVVIDPAAASLFVGATLQLGAETRAADGEILTGRPVSWSSDETGVATVNTSGRVTGVAPGRATITASSEGRTTTAVITVQARPVAAVEVSPAEATIVVDATRRLSATLRAENGSILTGRAVTWSSSDEDVAAVDEEGLVRGVGPGKATITATSEGRNATAAITVVPKPVASVVVSPPAATLLIGESQQFQATALAADGSELSGRAVAWSSSAPAIVEVSNTGRATARAVGGVTIRATIEGKVGTAGVAVGVQPVATVAVTPSTVALEVGATRTLQAITRAQDGTVLTGRGLTWSSNDEAIATVTGNGVVRGVAPGEARITASSEGKSGFATITVSPQPVATVSVSPAEVTLTVGETEQLEATLRDDDGVVLSGRTVEWSSSAPTLVGVDEDGRVTALAAGSATVTATSEGQSGSATITVNPKPVASVEVSPAGVALLIGETRQFHARALASDGSELTGRPVSWSSSAPEIVRVSSTGLATALAAGTATIRATVEGRVGTAAVAVGLQPVASVEVTPSSTTLEVGQTRTLQATTRAPNGSVLTGRTVVWSSDDEAVATVTSGGVVRGLRPGEATITATSEGESGTARVVVVAKPVATVTISPEESTVIVGASQQLSVTLRSGDGSTLSGRTVVWSSSDEAVATVNGSGRVTAIAVGEATITATSEGRSGTATITVTPKPVASVEVSPAGATLLVGETQQFEARALASDGSELPGRGVSWSSSAPNIVEISGTGLATALASGAATIRATVEGRVGTAGVAVGVQPVASVDVTPATATLEVDQTQALQATTRAANGSVLTDRTVVWSSEDESVATVSAGGVVRGIGPGEATITASSEGRSGTSTITVVPKPVATVSISPDEATMMVGETQQLSATLRASDGSVLSGRTISWSSDGANVATVNSSGLVTALGPGEAVITASSEGRSATSTITVLLRPVESVELSPASATLEMGESLQFDATARAQDGSVLVGRSVTWSSSAPDILEVSSSGLATALLPGAATVRATIEGKVGSAGVAVVPEPVASVEVTPGTLSLEVGQTHQLEAVTRDADGAVLTGRSVTWSSSNEAVATVSASGLVSGLAPGEATITASSEGRSGTASVDVSLQPVATVTVSPSSDTLFIGEIGSFTAVIRAANNDLLSGRLVTWSSSDEGVATVVDGDATALAAGTTTITASSEGRSGTASLRVLLPATQLNIVSGDGQTARNNETLPAPLVVRAVDANNDPVPGAPVRWGTDSGSITPTETRTGSDGTTAASWTPGGGPPGPRRAWAEIPGVIRVEFTATRE